MDRRSFLRGAAAGMAATPFMALRARAEEPSHRGGIRRGHTAGYGPLFPTLDRATGLPLLLLPEGFRYVTSGWTGDLMTDGIPTPGAHDGMAAFAAGQGRVRLVRNHERSSSSSPNFGGTQYDPGAAGGTTTLEFNTNKGEFLGAYGSLGGTLTNCAGGPTPWGSWLTCEETNAFRNNTTPHGYIFEVPADGFGDPVPIRDMGRFAHEAIAIDPVTGNVYETEDSGSTSGFYRYVPSVPGQLGLGGQLSMLKVTGVPQANLGGSYANGTTFDVEWVPIDQPDYAGAANSEWVFNQGFQQDAARWARLEGCWYGNDRRIYIVSTSGGIGQGQIWEYSPADETITLIFESPGAAVLNSPDNLTVSPRGGLVLCEDGSGIEFLHGLTVEGEIFKFAQNNVILNNEKNGLVGDFTGNEFAGACYSPDGRWLFVNIQNPGVTFAITGPWASGAL